MKTRQMRVSNYAIAGGVNWALLAVIAVALLGGFVAMQVGGFEFAPEAANLFLTKLPVLFLVALLIERTGEIFLSISRGGEAVSMEVKLETLTALRHGFLRSTTISRGSILTATPATRQRGLFPRVFSAGRFFRTGNLTQEIPYEDAKLAPAGEATAADLHDRSLSRRVAGHRRH